MKAKNSGWVSKKLGQIVEMTSGGTPDKKFKEYYDGGTIPWVRSGELDKGVITDSEVKITQAGLDNSSAKIFPKGTLLIAMYGATIGKLAYLGIDAATNQAICAMFKNDTILLEYLYYFLLFQRPNLVKQGVGGAQPNISQTILKKLVISYPEDLEEQKRIVVSIETLLSQLDEGVATLEKIQAQLKVYRQAVLKEAFSSDENMAKVSSICSVVRGGSPRPAGDERYYNGTIPFLKVADLTSNTNMYLNSYTYTIKEAGLNKTRQVPANTLLLSNSGATLGVPKICTFETTFNDGIAAFLDLDPQREYLPYHFYFWFSKLPEMRAIDQGAAQPNLNTTIIGDVEIPHYDFDKQKEIAAWIESRLSVCENIQQTVNSALQQADAMRKSILKQAFEGRL